jgi:hypothetical protein
MNHSTIQGLSVRSFSSLFVRPLLAGCFCWRAGSWISQPVRFNSRSDCTRQGDAGLYYPHGLLPCLRSPSLIATPGYSSLHGGTFLKCTVRLAFAPTHRAWCPSVRSVVMRSDRASTRYRLVGA